MSQGNQLCAEGCSRLATIYCLCTGQKTYLCDACFPSHRQKNPFLTHNTMDVQITTTPEVYQQRCGLFLERKRCLEGYLTKIETCYWEFEQKMNELLQKMQIYKETQLGQLNQYKEYARSVLEYSVKEVEASLVQDYPVLQGQLSPFMRGIEEQSPFFFDYSLEINAIYGNIEKILTCYWEKPQENQHFQAQLLERRASLPVISSAGRGVSADVVCEQCGGGVKGQGNPCKCVDERKIRQTRILQKKCNFCFSPVLSPCTVPPHLSMYQSFAKEVCSVKCLEQYQRLAENDTTCLGCKLPITDPKAPELPCHHKFHSKDCLFQLLETISNKFSIELTSIECPKCQSRCGLKDVIKYFPGSEYSDRKRWSLETSCTVCRNPAVIRMLRCGHGVCADHARGEGVFCICCQRYQDFY